MLLKTSPLHERTAPLVRAQTWRRWAGYQVASAYDPSPEREYAAIRNSAALLDITPLYKYHISGPDAERALDRMLTRNIARLTPGHVMYSPWCDAHGKMIDDGTLSRLDDTRYRLTSADPALRWLHLNSAGMRVRVEDVSDTLAALALQGPLSTQILSRLASPDVSGLAYFGLQNSRIAGRDVTISRTGYTGDLGYELWMGAADATAVWDELVRVGSDYGIVPAGIWALDIARIEAGLIMAGVDYHSAHHALIDAQYSSPFELGLGWTVNRKAGPFNGKQALELERATPSEWSFTGLEVDWMSFERLFARHGLPPQLPAVAWRTSAPVYRDGHQIGYATSGCWSPLLKKYIALAHVRSGGGPLSDLSLEVTVEHVRQRAAAAARKLPFFNPERKKL